MAVGCVRNYCRPAFSADLHILLQFPGIYLSFSVLLSLKMSCLGIIALRGITLSSSFIHMQFIQARLAASFLLTDLSSFNIKEKQDAARAALAKKTDEAVEDDEGGEDQQNEDDSEGVPQLEGDEEEVKDDEDAKDEVEEEGSEDVVASEVRLIHMW